MTIEFPNGDTLADRVENVDGEPTVSVDEMRDRLKRAD